MLPYAIKTVWLNLKASPVLSSLMVIITALGIGLFMTMMTITFFMSANPLAHKEGLIYRVQLDAGNPHSYLEDSESNIPRQITYIDAVNLLRQGESFKQNVSHGASGIVRPQDPTQVPFQIRIRATTSPLFDMFDAPFKFGSGWNKSDDLNFQQAVVLSEELNDQLFGDENSVGQYVNLNNKDFQVVGVLKEWKLIPRIYDMTSGFDATEQAFIPFSVASREVFERRGNTNCWKPVDGNTLEAFRASECVWMQLWVQLDSIAERDEYSRFIEAYIQSQKELGRFERPLRYRIHTIEEWLEAIDVVDNIVYVLLWATVLFLLVCLLNTIGLLLARMLSKAKEIGIRRALGASRASLFVQFTLETVVIGLLGGGLGLLVAMSGLFGIRVLFLNEPLMREFTSLNPELILIALATAIASSLLAGLYPMYRACFTNASEQLRVN